MGVLKKEVEEEKRGREQERKKREEAERRVEESEKKREEAERRNRELEEKMERMKMEMEGMKKGDALQSSTNRITLLDGTSVIFPRTDAVSLMGKLVCTFHISIFFYIFLYLSTSSCQVV